MTLHFVLEDLGCSTKVPVISLVCNACPFAVLSDAGAHLIVAMA